MALDWVEGRLEDVDVLLRSPLRPEAVFCVNLPDHASYRELLEICRHYHRAGARCFIARTGTAVVAAHLVKNGAIAGVFEPRTGKTRYFVPPEGFSRWIGKFVR